MKRFVLTSTTFSGTLTFAYDDTHTISGFFNDAQLSAEQLVWLHGNFPVTLALLYAMKENSRNLSMKEVITEITFEQFYEAYQLKVGKIDAVKAFRTLTMAQRVKAYENIPAYDAFLRHRPNQNKMYPATYLRGGYENDYKAMVKL